MGCSSEKKDGLFVLRNDTIAQFENKLTYTEDFNPYTYRNFYNGGGVCLLYTSPSPRDQRGSRMPSSA